MSLQHVISADEACCRAREGVRNAGGVPKTEPGTRVKRVALPNSCTANRQRTADNRQWTMHRERKREREGENVSERDGMQKSRDLIECAAKKLHFWAE